MQISKKQSEKLFDVIGDTKTFYAEVNDLEMDDDGHYICKFKCGIDNSIYYFQCNHHKLDIVLIKD